MILLILSSVLYVSLLMLLIWFIYCFQRNPGIVDVSWSLAIAVAGLNYLFSTRMSFIQGLFTVLLIVWSLRLSGYLLLTRIIPKHEDQRYHDISSRWKVSKLMGFLINYQFQGILAVMMATPFLFLNKVYTSSIWHILGMLLIMIGIIGESLADWQLMRYRRNPLSKVCDQGLWFYSRHPNYFFEWLIWVGFSVAAFSVAWGWLGILSPLLLLFLMLKITGPITEKTSLKSRGESYRHYQKTTPMFFPNFFKTSSS